MRKNSFNSVCNGTFRHSRGNEITFAASGSKSGVPGIVNNNGARGMNGYGPSFVLK